ncbi:MAG: mechanosensitive ion channel [Magnetococcales bacterium]|nr:mechanosensitive ion channel [Magnetococcales bacterium]
MFLKDKINEFVWLAVRVVTNRESPLRLISLYALLFIICFGPLVYYLFSDSAASSDKSNVLKIVLWLFFAFIANKIIKAVVWDGVVTRKLGHKPPKLLVNVSGFLVYVGAMSGIMVQVYDQSIVHFLTASGVIGIVLGFSLQRIIIDIFSGLTTNIDPAFKLHDWVLLHGRVASQNIFGCVKEVNWRTTRIQTEENVMVAIPNSLISSSVISNFNLPDEKSRFTINVCLDFSVSVERGLRLIQSGILEVAGKDGFLDNPAPKTLVCDITDNGVKYSVNYWLHPSKMFPDRGRHLAIAAVLNSLLRSGIVPTSPKHETVLSSHSSVQIDFDLPENRIKAISRIGFFSCLEKDEMREIADRMVCRSFPEGGTIFKHGDYSTSMFVLVEGIADVMININESQEKRKINTIKSGEIFGEITFLTGEKRTATVTFPTSAVVFEITKDSFQQVIIKRPDLARIFGIMIANKKLEVSNRDRSNKDMFNKSPDVEQSCGIFESMIRTCFIFVRGPDRRKTDQTENPYPPDKDRRSKVDRRTLGQRT